MSISRFGIEYFDFCGIPGINVQQRSNVKGFHTGCRWHCRSSLKAPKAR